MIRKYQKSSATCPSPNNYKGTDELHVGPVAEDFKQAFGLGVKGDAAHISTIDASGIALKAAQALQKKLEEKEAKIDQLEKRLKQLEDKLNTLLKN